mgnify:CR=1 FL=1
MDLLRKLSNAPGVSGYEVEAQRVVREALEPFADDMWTDRLGNLIAVKRRTSGAASAPARKLLYAAHIDEIGFMVSHVDDRGFIRFQPVGGFDARTLPSQRVTVHGTRGGNAPMQGVIAPQPRWLAKDSDLKRVIPLEELFVDTGLSGEEVQARINIGDVITLSKEFEVLNGSIVTGRNFDDRVGVYCMVEAFKQITDSSVDVYAVSTVQEEVGTRGIPTAAHAIAADICVAIDGSLPADTPFALPHQEQCRMGGGTGIYVMDKRTIGDPELLDALYATCEQHGIDASIAQRTGLGAKATTIGAPTRYIHSTVQMCDMKDIEATVALLAAFPARAADLIPADWR